MSVLDAKTKYNNGGKEIATMINAAIEPKILDLIKFLKNMIGINNKRNTVTGIERNKLDDDLQYRRQLLNLRVRSIARRLANDLQHVRNVLNEKDDLEIVILVIACNRFEALKEHLESLKSLLILQGRKIPIVVSLDCNDDVIRDLILSAGPNVTLIENPDQSSFNLSNEKKKYEGYYRIARHYRFALDYVFSILKYQSAIITEDDLLLAPDFWNICWQIENYCWKIRLFGVYQRLGWMLTSQLWEELKVKWPETFWDDWMRDSAQRQGRACIRPEISRTGISLRGKKGVSKGLYYEKHLKHIVVNTDFYHFSQSNLSYLKKDYYDPIFHKILLEAVPATLDEILKGSFSNGTVLPGKVRLHYVALADFKAFARKFGVMDDFRSGICRTCYHGVVSFRYGQRRIYMTSKQIQNI
ncbi:MGAT1 [Dirofilaria immitis]|nr:MGAT1 [Dirofilaria immitis]